MRALGPGSVSSILKIGLDVFHLLLWVVLVACMLAVLGILIFAPFVASQTTMDAAVNGEADPARIRAILRSPVIPGVAAAFALYVGGLVFIVGRLKQVFVTLTRGDPFQPDNVRRLRRIGFTLGGIELLSYGVRSLVAWWSRSELDGLDVNLRQVGGDFNPTLWFAVLVVFVLAEVFREGARLRREAELTI